MGTWNSLKEFSFHCDAYIGDNSRYEWEYQTTADVFTLKMTRDDCDDAYGFGKVNGCIQKMYFGSDEIRAVYKCIRNFLLIYEGEHIVKRLDDELKPSAEAVEQS